MLNHEVVLSKFILDELKGKLVDKFKFSSQEASGVARLMKSRSTVVTTSPLLPTICRDPDDDNIIATAMSRHCACIVTGDKDLLDLNTVNGISVLSPGAFWQFEQR